MKRELLNWACGSFAVLSFAWVTFNIAFDLGLDTALCVVEVMQEDKRKAEVVACSRASPVESSFIQGVRQSWLWATSDEVQS